MLRSEVVYPRLSTHVHAGAHDLVHQQQLRGDDGRRVQDLALDAVVVVDTHHGGAHGLPSHHVDADDVALHVLVRQLDVLLLRVEAGVLRERLRDHQQRLRECLHAQLSAPLHGAHNVFAQVGRRRNLKRPRSLHHRAVVEHVIGGPQSVAHGVLDLRDAVVVLALDEDGASTGLGGFLHEGVDLVSEDVFVHQTREPARLGDQLLHRVHRVPSAAQAEALHVPLLGAPQAHDPLPSEHLQRDGVDALLVNHHEILVRAVAHLLLERDDRLHALVRELALGFDQLLALVRAAVEEPRIHLGLLVLEGDVAGEDVAVGDVLLHVGVARAVVEHKPVDELGVGLELVAHVHDLNHVKVGRGVVVRSHAQQRVYHDVCKLLRNHVRDFRREGCARHAPQNLAVQCLAVLACVHFLLECVQEFQRGLLCHVEALHDDTRVQPLREVPLRLLQDLAYQQHHARRAISCDVVLGGRCARDHHRRGVLNLHLAQKNVAVLCQLQIS
mmetsp:Transcript_17658/g.29671  ORF Transcript_17658/g.29671 Transcript_17658/m.29671 type:complete len:499 (-) Transcript_17658:368-1864(-)